MDAPILFIFGAPRSGTTFINALIRDYFDYGLCAEGQWVLRMGRKAPKYGDLGANENLIRLIHDVRKDYMFEHFRVYYSRIVGRSLDITVESILHRMTERSYPGLVYAVFACVAEQLRKTHVGNKFPDYWQDLPQLHSWFPNARFLHVVRDGRDVALSSRKVRWGENSAYACARKWSRVMDVATQFKSSVARNQFHTISYEELLQQPNSTVSRLESFLNTRLESHTRARMLNVLQKSNQSHPIGKWKRQFCTSDQRIYEAVAGHWLSSLGYDTTCDSPRVGQIERLYYGMAEVARKAKLTMQTLGSNHSAD